MIEDRAWGRGSGEEGGAGVVRAGSWGRRGRRVRHGFAGEGAAPTTGERGWPGRVKPWRVPSFIPSSPCTGGRALRLAIGGLIPSGQLAPLSRPGCRFLSNVREEILAQGEGSPAWPVRKGYGVHCPAKRWEAGSAVPLCCRAGLSFPRRPGSTRRRRSPPRTTVRNKNFSLEGEQSKILSRFPAGNSRVWGRRPGEPLIESLMHSGRESCGQSWIHPRIANQT